MLKKYALRYLPALCVLFFLLPVKILLDQREISDLLFQQQNQDNSATIRSLKTQALYALAFSSPQEAWAAGGSFIERKNSDGQVLQVNPAGGTLWHYTQGNWIFSQTTSQPLLGLSLAPDGSGWAAGYAGVLLHYDGQDWKSVQSPTQQVLEAVATLSAQEAWAVGAGGTILHYTGTAWTSSASPTTVDLRSISMVNADDGWIVGDSGVLLHYQQHSWQLVASPTSEQLHRVTMLSANEGWAVGDQATILHYRSGTWDSVETANNQSISSRPAFNDIALTSFQSGWIVGEQGLLNYVHEVWNRTADGSLDETLLENLSNVTLYRLTMISSAEGWAVGSLENDLVFLHYQAGLWQVYQ